MLFYLSYFTNPQRLYEIIFICGIKNWTNGNVIGSTVFRSLRLLKAMCRKSNYLILPDHPPNRIYFQGLPAKMNAICINCSCYINPVINYQVRTFSLSYFTNLSCQAIQITGAQVFFPQLNSSNSTVNRLFYYVSKFFTTNLPVSYQNEIQSLD